MPILKNAKHEMFAHSIAKGSSPGKAYSAAGYTGKGADQSAAKLLKNTKIISRIEEIKSNIAQIAESKAGIDKAYVLGMLQKNLEIAMQKHSIIGVNGKSKYVYEGNVANRALELMGKELGMFKEHKTLETPDLLEALKVIYVDES